MKTIKINGPIVNNDYKEIYDFFDMEATAPKDIIDNLPDDAGDVTISINSYGGHLDAGNEMYTALRNYPGNVTVEIIMAGSAASIIAMAGDNIGISPVGQIMIHNVSMGAQGDHRDMKQASVILSKANQSIAKAYQLKTGLSEADLLDLMNSETWLTADGAKDFGFADYIMFEETNEEKPLLVANALVNGMLPETVIEKYKQNKFNDKDQSENKRLFLF